MSEVIGNNAITKEMVSKLVGIDIYTVQEKVCDKLTEPAVYRDILDAVLATFEEIDCRQGIVRKTLVATGLALTELGAKLDILGEEGQRLNATAMIMLETAIRVNGQAIAKEFFSGLAEYFESGSYRGLNKYIETIWSVALETPSMKAIVTHLLEEGEKSVSVDGHEYTFWR